MKLRNLSELTLEKTDRSIFTDIGRCKASVRVVATQDVNNLSRNSGETDSVEISPAASRATFA